MILHCRSRGYMPLLILFIILISYTVNSFTFWSMKIRRTFPHDATAFTEGLCLDPKSLHSPVDQTVYFESSGVPGKSELRQVELSTGKVLNRAKLSSDWGQGCAIVDDTIYQLTFEEGRIRAFDMNNVNAWFNESSATSVKPTPAAMREGWGMTSNASNHGVDPVRLYASDGTSTLFKLNSSTLEPIGSVTVHFPNSSQSGSMFDLDGLNELEVIKQEVWANLFGRSCIARINPSNGELTGIIVKPDDVEGGDHPAVQVMNGIVWLPESRTVLVTGKNWPNIYQVKIVRSNLLNEMNEHESPKALFDKLCPTAEFTEADAAYQQSLVQ